MGDVVITVGGVTVNNPVMALFGSAMIGLVLTAPDGDRFVISRELFSFEPFALAVRRNDADFRLIADRVLSHLYGTGQIDQIYDKWFGAFSKDRPPLLDALYKLNATPE